MVKVTDDGGFFVANRLGPKQSTTPEGFLLVEGVPLARVGEQIYGPGELPGIELGSDGRLVVDRPEEEVFRPETIASFEGKDVTNDHPPEDVTPENWRSFSVGHVQNVRRGEGELSDFLLGDMIIKDAVAIDAVREGKREVSCGYDAEYEQLAPGQARQHDIIGNHVALVLRGRCGHRCAIGDEEMRTTDKKLSWRDRLNRAFKSKDADEFEAAMKEAPAEDEDMGAGENGDTHVHVHLPGDKTAAAETPANDEAEEELPGYFKNFKEAYDAQMGELTGNLKTLSDSFNKFLGQEQNEGTHDEDGENDDPDAEENKTNDEDSEEKKEDEKKSTTDSASLKNEFEDTVARAEVLWPGVKLPTFDSKSTKAKTIDNICHFRRRVLDHVLSSDDAASVTLIESVAGKKVKKFTGDKAFTCDAVRAIFVATSESVKARNNANAVRKQVAMTRDSVNKTHRDTVQDINKRNRDFYNNHR